MTNQNEGVKMRRRKKIHVGSQVAWVQPEAVYILKVEKIDPPLKFGGFEVGLIYFDEMEEIK